MNVWSAINLPLTVWGFLTRQRWCFLYFFLAPSHNESLSSEGNSQVGIRGWGWATCLQSLLKALGLAPGMCAWGHRFCFHLIHQPCSEQWCWWARSIPQLSVDLLGVLSGFRAGEQLPGREGMKGIIWGSTSVYFSNIFRGLLMFRVLGSFSFSFSCLLCLGIQATMVV